MFDREETGMASRYRRLDEIARSLPEMRDPQGVRRRVEAAEMMLERLVTIPGTNRQVGLDVMLDLLPGFGSVIAGGLGAWMLWEARNLGMSKWQMARMGANIGVDTLLGMIPFVGAIPDFFFRSNTRNLRIIKRHLDKHHPATVTLDGRG
jgi:hypothetical protein